MTDSNNFNNGGGDAFNNKSSSLLDKIKLTLANTAPERWEEAGEELDSSKKYQKSRDAWEQVFCTDAKNGVLVLRCSTPVRGNYFGGGYALVENGVPQYTVELRPRGWAPKMLVDPYYRTAGGVEREYQTLVEGDIARQIYFEIKTIVIEHRESMRRDFNDSVERLMSVITDRVKQTYADEWELHHTDRNVVKYSATIEGLVLEIAQFVKDRNFYFEMTLSKYGLKWECRDTPTMRDVFKIVDDCVKHTSLEQLDKVLEDIL